MKLSPNVTDITEMAKAVEAGGALRHFKPRQCMENFSATIVQ